MAAVALRRITRSSSVDDHSYARRGRSLSNCRKSSSFVGLLTRKGWIGGQELGGPPILRQKLGARPFEDGDGGVERFDRGQAVLGVAPELAPARIGGDEG